MFSELNFTDLYDAFIESNKKEDVAERMWSIRSVVSVFVWVQVSGAATTENLYCMGTTRGRICLLAFILIRYFHPKSYSSDFQEGSRIVIRGHCDP